MVCFDYNATTPLLPVAREAWVEAATTCPGNPSSPHRLGSRAAARLDDARERVAALIGCPSPDIVWTSGATEAANTVFYHAARTLPPGRDAWVAATEHPCVLSAAERWLPGRHRHIPVLPSGVADLERLRLELSRESPGLVAVMAANNETGVIQPWLEIAGLCREHNVLFACDAVQWLGKLPSGDLGQCDFVMASAHKFGGPRGVGFLKCPGRGRLHALLVGGHQELGRRAGTENVPGVCAMIAALEFRNRQILAGEDRVRLQWRADFERVLTGCLPGATITGGAGNRLWNTVAVVMPETDRRERWVIKLDKAGFAVSTGSACSSGQEKPSHVLAAMGLSPAQAARALRFSSGWETTTEDWQRLAEALIRVYEDNKVPTG